MTGHVIIDEHGDRRPDYSIQIVQDGHYVTLLDYIAIKSSRRSKRATENSLTKVYKADKPGDWSGIKWANHKSAVPSGEPKCGWNHVHCWSEKHTCSSIQILIVLPHVLFD